MRAVLYSDSDMEAITVIDVPEWAMAILRTGRAFRFPAPTLPCIELRTDPPRLDRFPMVEVWAERFVRRGVAHWMLFTRQDEVALLLRAEFLPGQRQEVAAQYRRGLVDGFLRAVSALRDD